MSEEELLIDYLEKAAEYLSERERKLRELTKQYNEIYDKQLKEEIEEVRREIQRKRAEIVERLYENVDELRHLKKYFPELLEVFKEYEGIGKMIRKKSFLFENAKPLSEREAAEKISMIIAERRQLRDAKKFLEKWTGTINGKQLGATYPILKDAIKGDVEKEEAMEIINGMNRERRKAGWLILLNSPLINGVLQRLIERKKILEFVLAEKQKKYEEAKGRGTAAEYNAKKALEDAENKVNKINRMIKHILLTNPDLVSALKKGGGWLKTKESQLEKIAREIPIKRVREKTWLELMRKRVSS